MTLALTAIVRIGVLGLFQPEVMIVGSTPGCAVVVEAGARLSVLEGSQRMRVRASGNSVEFAADGATTPMLRASPRGVCEFVLAVPGKIERRYRGELEIGAHGGVLTAVVAMDRETAVASAVAAESPPGAALAALMAQAVVTRSYYAAARGRHAGFDFCDTTHCQFLRAPPEPDAPASIAAQRTRGLVLTWRGAPLPALFSASCGGSTRALANPGAGEYPYFAVDCPYCRRGPRVRCSYCDPAGAGAGHGFGLCQTGAKGMAAAGAGFREILVRYFPNTEVAEPLP
jgi:stage II sporulation protein D